jgi:hypothetical protein
MALSLGVPVVHVITGETEDLMSALITAYSGGGASTEITVRAISSFCISRCGRLRGKWSIGVCLSRELDDFIIRVQWRRLCGGQWWWSGVFV